MPKRTDIKKILIIGSGPIIIGQGCEFDYSGTQACKALKEEGYKVVLVNSNPATIMTDPEFADRTYIEPITVDMVEKIIAREKPDAFLPTLGGQTGLNLAVELAEKGILKKFGVEVIGAKIASIQMAEERELFKNAMAQIGLDLPKSQIAHTVEEAKAITQGIGFPVVIRPSFTLGGTGGGVAFGPEELEEIVAHGLDLSMRHEVLVEESVIGWKEFELEVMRDIKDNVVIICSIENMDPMGIHTGDSITVSPAQTLTDKEYQLMRNQAIAVIRKIGVETGGSNIQFAVHPETGRMVIIEMNPRVSRSSALASKATGFPIAKIATKLAIGYTLDEIPNDITAKTPASFEPTIDYCVVKIPRWAFEKFPTANPVLTIQMKSVGETMAIGRTFKEALQKGIRGLEIGRFGLGKSEWGFGQVSQEEIQKNLSSPGQDRLFYISAAFHHHFSIEKIHRLTKIDPWFLHQIYEIFLMEIELSSSNLDPVLLRKAKQYGFSDMQIAKSWKMSEQAIREFRKKEGIEVTFKRVDTCAAEFEAFTPYYYSTYEVEDEVKSSSKKKIMILGGGPNRIGQGIEFDYCCVHASFALKEIGYETIMVNSNPETVSTDYDTSDRLYFEPLTREDVLNIVDREKPDGVIVQFGGQTPLNLARGLEASGVPIIGTSPDAIDRAEDRERFKELIEKLSLTQPENGIATTVEQAKREARRIGFPVLLRPSYVLGGRAMEIVYDDAGLEYYMKHAVFVSGDRPVLIDKFLDDASEVDVDMISDGEMSVIGGILEHVEQAGVHSGDSAMVMPPFSLKGEVLEKIRENTDALAKELGVVGLMNVQYAVKGGTDYILEVNPRASRTIPFVSKAIGVPLAKLAAKVMTGVKLKDLGSTREIIPPYMSVKESVLPFSRFHGVDIILGPEMKSTGEVMGIDSEFGRSFIKSQLAAGQALPKSGNIFVTVKDKDKKAIVPVAKKLSELGYTLVATEGTHAALQENRIPARKILKIKEGSPNALDLIRKGEIHLIINTPTGKDPKSDEAFIRSLAVQRGVPCVTTIPGAIATVRGIEAYLKGDLEVCTLQERHLMIQEKVKQTVGQPESHR